MALRAAMAADPGKEQPQAVEQFGDGAKSAPDAGDGRPLVKSQGRRDILDVVQVRPVCLRKPAAGIGGERFEVATGALGVEDAQSQR
ncbi:MAG: hypothetical protein PHI87_02035 [Candidatus Methanomethylophilus sp.]|nr:hypothetical protein [Methanomethylophilus sp.]